MPMLSDGLVGCGACHGEGYVWKARLYGGQGVYMGVMLPETAECARCDGTGSLAMCHECGGIMLECDC